MKVFGYGIPIGKPLMSHIHAQRHVCTTLYVVGSDYWQPLAMLILTGIPVLLFSKNFSNSNRGHNAYKSRLPVRSSLLTISDKLILTGAAG